MSSLEIDYATHDGVVDLILRLQYCFECVSLSFDRWEKSTEGPGLYAAVIADREYGNYADPMGDNRWPTETCQAVRTEDALIEAGRQVATTMDGGIVVGVDGYIEPQLVRFRSPDTDSVDSIDYKSWMGARHMSALETSTRPEVVATITLSGESGRVSVFRDGDIETATRDELGGQWRV